MSSSEKLLEGQNAIITGGSSGIGKAVAIGFAKLGANVGIIGRDEEKLKSVQSEIVNAGFKCEYAVGDVIKYESINAAVQKLISLLGKVHILVNNAGLSRMKALAKMPVPVIDSMLDTNIKGVIYTTHAALPHMIENGEGTIINTSSIASVNFATYMVVYSATKAAVNAFTEALSMELKSKKINVNAILPGFVDTPLLRLGTTDDQVKMLNPIQPEDLLPYFTFFASSKGRKVTGTLANAEEIREALKLVSKLPEGEKATWATLEPIFKENNNPKSFAMLKSNKKLIETLLGNS